MITNHYGKVRDVIKEGSWLTSEAINIMFVILDREYQSYEVKLMDPYFVSLLLFEDDP
jgi:hypothetical protein